VLSSDWKGAIAEAKIAAAAIELGVPVLRPIVEHARYDLGFEIGDRIYRVQCKWGALDADGAVIKIRVGGSWLSPTSGYVRSTYSADEIDLLAIYCADLRRCYLLPVSLVAGRAGIQLRLTPPKNGQRACINLAEDFELPGAVAQLVEHLNGIQRARGSSPLSSTPSPAPPETLQVGANQFRNHFGYYLEQAGEGREVLVSRRGRPYVRVSPVEPRLELLAA
jgi:prevent-host-death family protein